MALAIGIEQTQIASAQRLHQRLGQWQLIETALALFKKPRTENEPPFQVQSAVILPLHAEAGKRIVCGGPNQFDMRG